MLEDTATEIAIEDTVEAVVGTMTTAGLPRDSTMMVLGMMTLANEGISLTTLSGLLGGSPRIQLPQHVSVSSSLHQSKPRNFGLSPNVDVAAKIANTDSSTKRVISKQQLQISPKTYRPTLIDTGNAPRGQPSSPLPTYGRSTMGKGFAEQVFIF